MQLRRMAFLTWLALTSVSNAQSGGKTWLIAVGVDNYIANSITDLRYAGADAKLLSQAFADLAKVPSSNLTLLTTDSLQDDLFPRATNIVHCLSQLKSQCGREDTVVFFFAGHGATIDGQSFLLTEEADSRSLATLKTSSLKAQELSGYLRAIPARQILLILDCCRNDPTGKGPTLEPTFSADFSLTGKSEQNATLFACNVGQRSWEWAEKQHGFFSYFLATGLHGDAAQSDGQITLSSLIQHLASVVPLNTLKYAGAEQTPMIRYEGPGLDQWTLVKRTMSAKAKTPTNSSTDAKLAAELDASRARLEKEQAARKQAEDRLALVESERRQLSARLEIMEKQAQAIPLPSQGQPLVAARDQAMIKLQTAQQNFEKQRQAGPPDLELLQAEKDQLVAENAALQAHIKVLELKLGKGNLSASRDFTIAQDPKLTELKTYSQNYAQPQSPEGLRATLASLNYESDLWVKRLDQVEAEGSATLAATMSSHPELRGEVEALQAKLEIYQQSAELLKVHIRVAETALQESEIRLQQALAQARAAETELAEVRRTMGAELDHLRRENQRLALERAQFQQQAEAARQQLDSSEADYQKHYPGRPYAKADRPWGTSTRRVGYKDLLIEPNAGEPEATEIPKPPPGKP